MTDQQFLARNARLCATNTNDANFNGFYCLMSSVFE